MARRRRLPTAAADRADALVAARAEADHARLGVGRAGPRVEQLAVHVRLDRLAADGDPVWVAGNLPYAITSPLLFHFLDQIAHLIFSDVLVVSFFRFGRWCEDGFG